MTSKTYGVSGLMDCTMQIKVGKGSVAVHFTGGALTAYGVTPAKFTTDSPFFQRVIEDSEQFKNGRIEFIGAIEVPDKETANRPVQKKNPALEQKQDEQGISDTDGAGGGEVKVADKSEAIEWLKEHFPEKGYTATGLRTVSAFEAACKENGVKFIFTS